MSNVLKTWLMLLREDTGFSGVHITPKSPDEDKAFTLPCVVLKRVGEDSWNLARLSGYFREQDNEEDTTQLDVLRGYTYRAMYQFDILATTNNKINELSTKLNNILKSGDDSDIFVDGEGPKMTVITLKDFADSGSIDYTETDLLIKFKYWRDVSGNDVKTFDPELLQYSISVGFWVDYLQANTYPKLASVGYTATLSEE